MSFINSLSSKLETLKLELRENGILIVFLSRVARRNAFTKRMSDELIEVYQQADVDPDVKIVVMTGTGDYFCAGADLESNLDADPLLGKQATQFSSSITSRDLAGRVVLSVLACRKPCIAALNGSAVGVGITMTLAMDVRVVAQDAKIGFVFVRRGLVPEGCSSMLLSRLVGQTRALDWCLTGRVFTAQSVADSGLFTRVVPKADVMSVAMDYAQTIATQCSPVMVMLTKALLWQGLRSDPSTAHLIESKGIDFAFGHADAIEGFSSFLAKREPNFQSSMNADLPSFFPWWTTTNVDLPLGGIGIKAKL